MNDANNQCTEMNETEEENLECDDCDTIDRHVEIQQQHLQWC